jgi:GMP synthase (glutamine-hydrolysing)
MRLMTFQHVPFEDLGSIRQWAVNRGHTIATTRFFAGDGIPDLHELDWLIVMGGPMGTRDEDRYDWLRPEKAFIRSAIDHGKTVVGICLGAQLVAEALGAKVYPNSHREIGWFELKKEASLPSLPVVDRFPDRLEAFHWHGDTFDIPEGAVLLAGTEACKHQGFLWGRQVVGLQFHLETTPESLERLITHCGADLVPGPFVQTPEAMRSGAERFDRINLAISRLLDTLLEP